MHNNKDTMDNKAIENVIAIATAAALSTKLCDSWRKSLEICEHGEKKSQ